MFTASESMFVCINNQVGKVNNKLKSNLLLPLANLPKTAALTPPWPVYAIILFVSLMRLYAGMEMAEIIHCCEHNTKKHIKCERGRQTTIINGRSINIRLVVPMV